MYDLLLTLLLVMSAIIVIAVFMQPQKNPLQESWFFYGL